MAFMKSGDDLRNQGPSLFAGKVVSLYFLLNSGKHIRNLKIRYKMAKQGQHPK